MDGVCNMTIINRAISKDTILREHNSFFEDLIKAVVDIENGIMAVDAELHSDLEAFLLTEGSEQKNLWGVNLYLRKDKKDWVEYTALINIRPSANNRWMEIEDSGTRGKIEDIVRELIVEENVQTEVA